MRVVCARWYCNTLCLVCALALRLHAHLLGFDHNTLRDPLLLHRNLQRHAPHLPPPSHLSPRSAPPCGPLSFAPLLCPAPSAQCHCAAIWPTPPCWVLKRDRPRPRARDGPPCTPLSLSSRLPVVVSLPPVPACASGGAGSSARVPIVRPRIPPLTPAHPSSLVILPHHHHHRQARKA